MAGVDYLVVYMRTAVTYKTFYIHYPRDAKRPRVVYIQTAVSWGSLHIHPETANTDNFGIFLSPHPVVVYISESPSEGFRYAMGGRLQKDIVRGGCLPEECPATRKQKKLLGLQVMSLPCPGALPATPLFQFKLI